MTQSRPSPTVVIGGGIAGLAAAHFLAGGSEDAASRSPGGAPVLVLEGSREVGGKLRRRQVAGAWVDVGAEAMLNRRPEGVDLTRQVGLEIVHPAAAASHVWTRDELRPLPRSLMGVPLDLESLERSGVLSADGLERVRAERAMGPSTVDGDVSVGALAAERVGHEAVERLVEPLLGGVYAGHARELSARACVPQLVDAATRGSILAQAATISPTYQGPVFAGIPGGMGLLAEALAGSRRFEVRTAAPVRELRRTAEGFELTVGSAADPERVVAGRVVLATPAAPTARLLAGVAPAAAAELAAVESASVAVVTFAFRAADVPDLPGSGFLVPPVEGRQIKASTFSSAKWAWVRGAGGADRADGVVFLRTSLGRHREEAALQVPDEELVAVSRADLADAVGLRAAPVDVHVQRWGGGLPQYAVGHLDRVARVRADVAAVPGLAVCGAAYDGVGIPAVIASARRAVELLARAQWPT